jgi:hypothetical protein
MSAQPNPNERFDEVDSTLQQLSNSFRHLLTAQVLMHDRQGRAEATIEKAAQTILALADSQKHTDEKLAGVADKLDALTDIVRKWYDRPSNGSGAQHPS